MSNLHSVGAFEIDFTFEPKPWMRETDMHLVTDDMIPAVMDECIASSHYALDLETNGLDTRVFNGRTVTTIVGVCLSPDGIKGYYIPLCHKEQDENLSPHNVSISLFDRHFRRLMAADSVAIFHNAKYDQELLEFNGGEPYGNWGDLRSWEDTQILAYLKDNRAKRRGLKFLSKTELSLEQIQFKDLFPKEMPSDSHNFANLDPTHPGVVEYAAGDAICTFRLYFKLRDEALILPSKNSDGTNHTQNFIYSIEKLCSVATRWMERNRIKVDRKKVAELIQLGQTEYMEALREVYTSAKSILKRDVTPVSFYVLEDMIAKLNPELEAYHTREQESLKAMIKASRVEGKRIRTILEKGGMAALDMSPKYQALVDRKAPKGFMPEYDVQSQKQLGTMLKEMKVPDLEETESSGQVKTSKDFIEKAAEKHGDKFPFLIKIKKFREVWKALSTYLHALYEDTCSDNVCNECGHTFQLKETDKCKQCGEILCEKHGYEKKPCPQCASPNTERDNTIKIQFRGDSTDTGRFSVPQGKNLKKDGVARYPMQGTPAQYDPSRPACMTRIREVFIAKPGTKLAAIDFAGVELRLVSNVSGEPKWINEFFRCSDCEMTFDRGDGSVTPEAPPAFCPGCGGDKIGDIHTLTALSVYGQDAKKKNPPKKWKKLRKNGKFTNFSLCYGGGYRAVMNAAGCTKSEAYHIKNTFDGTYLTLFGWWDVMRTFARKWGYVRTAFGRKLPLPNINHEDGYWRSKAERNATNGPIQGCSADVTKMAMGLIYLECKKRDWLQKVQMVITMHDELVFYIAHDILEEALEVICGIMTRNKAILGRKWPVPLTVDVELGHDWTVPWNLANYRYNIEPWPEELLPFFPNAEIVEIPAKGKGEKPLAEIKFIIKSQTTEMALSLAESIHKSRCTDGTGKRLILLDKSGSPINWVEDHVFVNEEKFNQLVGGQSAIVN